mmetsp:Transcript_25597/g.38383  ORF Transcript_25597/g.38383 Transcript_25597/m.38383 type:complete len:430 (+) Transcript_25597:72-1361(+)
MLGNVLSLCFPMKLIGFITFLPAFARASYPEALKWEGCENGSLCATLEFCGDDSNFGYRTIGDETACGSKPGPLIRMTPGNTYKLTLRNNILDSNVNTNIHTHGLHISGSGDADDATRSVSGGSCLNYTWNIPNDHPGGTYWYHPHYHTAANKQTGGGAFGMLIIDDNYDAVNYWAHTSNELLLQIFKSGSSLLANGNSNEKIEVAVNKWYRLRVSAVAPKAKPKTISFDGGSCTIYKIASDGVWNSANLTSYPGLSFELTGASRADFAIKCATVGNTSIKWGKITAATIETKNYTILGTGQSSTGNDVADLGEAPRRPNSLSWTESPCGEDCFYDVTLSKTQINGKPWDKDIPLKNIDYGKVYEWSISGSKKHPFHLHLYHMKIVTPGGCGAHKEGEFYDTISAPGDCEIQFKAIDIGQRMIMVRVTL